MKRGPFQLHLFPALLMTFAIYATISVNIRDAEAASTSNELRKARKNQKGGGGANHHSSETLVVISEPTFRKVAKEGEDVQLHCSGNKTSWSSCEWYKVSSPGGPAKRITQFFDRYQRITSCRLQIQGVTYEDAGIILCKATSNSTNTFNFTSQLTVTGPGDPYGNNLPKPSINFTKAQPQPYSEPELVENLLPEGRIQLAYNGGNVLLKCKAVGYPTPLVIWRRGTKNYTEWFQGESNLKLTNLTRQGDEGAYTCEAVNIFGRVSAEVFLKVEDTLKGASEILDLTPRNMTLYEGGFGNLTCIAKFEGDPWFVWVKKIDNRTGGMNTFTYEGQDYSVLPKTEIRPFGPHLFATTLLLQNVTMAMTGNYHCIVAGTKGYNHSEAYVTVEPDPSKLHMAQSRRHKTVAILWIFSFVVFAALVILCIVRVCGCPMATKKKPSGSSRASIPSDPSGKIEMHKGSPTTLSTDCTPVRQDMFSSFPAHSTQCSLASQELSSLLKQDQDCRSSCRTYNSYDPECSFGDDDSDPEITSYMMADLEVARSAYSCAASSCDSELCSQQSFASPSDYHRQISGHYEPHRHNHHHHHRRQSSGVRWSAGSRSSRNHHNPLLQQQHHHHHHHHNHHPHPQFLHQVTKCDNGELSHSVVPATSICSCNSDSCIDEQNSQVSLVYVL